MKRTVKVAVCQILANDGDREGNFLRVEYALETASNGRAELAAFPESVILGWENADAHRLGAPIPGVDSEFSWERRRARSRNGKRCCTRETQRRLSRGFSQCFADRQQYTAEWRLRRGDGEYRWVLSQGSPRFGPDGRFLGYAGAVFDMTEQKEAEQRLRAANAVLAANLDELRQKEDEIRALSARLIDAQEEERTRLSRVLHDDLSQQIAALSLGMGNLKRGLPADLGETRTLSDRIQQRLVGLSEAVRRISHEPHPSVLQHAGLAAALRGHCRELHDISGSRVDVRTSGDLAGIRPAVSLCIYRIAQEALRNVSRHAQTRGAEIELTRGGGEIRLVVSDRGVGFATAGGGRRPGLGLVSMRERTRPVGGTVVLRSAPGEGTTLTVRIPDEAAKTAVTGT